MLLHADSVAQDTTIEADLCIVGSGAAGLTLALQFIGSGRRVCLLESGGLDFEPETQDLYAGEVVGHECPPLDIIRLRFFGGTTNHWTGMSRPLDPLDFEERPHVPNSGWPFTYEHLVPYYERAHQVIGLGPFTYRPTKDDAPRELFHGGGGRLDFAPEPLRFESDVIDPTGLLRTRALRFGEAYRAQIEQAEEITTLLNANVVDIETTENAAEVTRLRVATLGGRRFWVKGRAYVLAAGGLENPRLLLNATKVERAGLGNRFDNVGRYFQDHPLVEHSANIVFSRYMPEASFYLKRVDDGLGQWGFFCPTPAAQRNLRLMNCGIAFFPSSTLGQVAGAASLKHIFGNLKEAQWPDAFGHHVAQVVADMDELVASAYHKAMGHGPRHYRSFYWAECAPDPDSRVTLGDAVDPLGQRRIRLDWRIPAGFDWTYTRVHELLAQELGRHGLGRVQVLHAGLEEDPARVAETSHHHMGTTRMHVDPRKGVVDPDCRVHGIANLYIAGSSVFPTYGHTNPTITIVALALRLADHLKRISA